MKNTSARPDFCGGAIGWDHEDKRTHVKCSNDAVNDTALCEHCTEVERENQLRRNESMASRLGAGQPHTARRAG